MFILDLKTLINYRNLEILFLAPWKKRTNFQTHLHLYSFKLHDSTLNLVYLKMKQNCNKKLCGFPDSVSRNLFQKFSDRIRADPKLRKKVGCLNRKSETVPVSRFSQISAAIEEFNFSLTKLFHRIKFRCFRSKTNRLQGGSKIPDSVIGRKSGMSCDPEVEFFVEIFSVSALIRTYANIKTKFSLDANEIQVFLPFACFISLVFFLIFMAFLKTLVSW